MPPISSRRLRGLGLVLSWGIILWLALNLFFEGSTELRIGLSICPLRLVTQVPCASCGTTRALCALLEGQWLYSLWLNPLGFVVAIYVLVSLSLMAYDYCCGRDSYYWLYLRVRHICSHRYIVVGLLLLLFLNWIWNIHKAL